MKISLIKAQDIKLDRIKILNRVLKALPAKKKPGAEAKIADEEVQGLLEDIRNARKEWDNAVLNFEYAGDQETIDYYTYKIKACLVRYEHLLKQAKEKGLKVELKGAPGLFYNGNEIKSRTYR